MPSAFALQRLHGLNEKALARMLVNAQDYEKGVIQAVQHELEARGLNSLELEVLFLEIETQPDLIERQAKAYEGVISWFKRRLGM
ncbi:MAG: hypothetical protein AAF399_22435 [Bacteroidota bacterium]